MGMLNYILYFYNNGIILYYYDVYFFVAETHVQSIAETQVQEENR